MPRGTSVAASCSMPEQKPNPPAELQRPGSKNQQKGRVKKPNGARAPVVEKHQLEPGDESDDLTS